MRVTSVDTKRESLIQNIDNRSKLREQTSRSKDQQILVMSPPTISASIFSLDKQEKKKVVRTPLPGFFFVPTLLFFFSKNNQPLKFFLQNDRVSCIAQKISMVRNRERMIGLHIQDSRPVTERRDTGFISFIYLLVLYH